MLDNIELFGHKWKYYFCRIFLNIKDKFSNIVEQRLWIRSPAEKCRYINSTDLNPILPDAPLDLTKEQHFSISWHTVRFQCNRALRSSIYPSNILELFAALSALNAWFTILHGGNSWWLHQKPTGTSKLVDSCASSLTGIELRLRDDRKGGRRKEKKGERKINDTRISVIAWWFCEGDTGRGGGLGNDKLRFDFISRGDVRHHGEVVIVKKVRKKRNAWLKSSINRNVFCICLKIMLYYYAYIVILIFNANCKSILSHRVEEIVLFNVKHMIIFSLQL